MAKIGLVAADYGESKCLDSVALELEGRGHNCIKLLGQGKKFEPSEDDVQALLIESSLLIVAISENNELEVDIAKQGHTRSIPIVIYAPGNGACHKTSATPMREFASLLLLGNREDEVTAKQLFLKAKVSTVGNVLHEEGYPAATRDESRRMLGVDEDKKVIFVPLDKRIGINWPLLHSVIEACHRDEVLSYNPVIVAGIHPGDQNPSTCYSDAAEFSRRVPVFIKTRAMMPGIKIVPGCDLMITAGSTLGEVAAYQRKPVIGFFFENIWADFERQKGAQVPFVWGLEENEAARSIKNGSIDDLAKLVSELLSEEHHLCLKPSQRKHYPTPPEPGSTAKRIANAIEEKFFPR